MKLRLALASLALLSCLAAAAYRFHAAAAATARPSLTTYVPQDALLSIESPDFASLLNRWSNSPQSKAWLASDSYSVFQNSRLFGRLGDAQTSFETAAGVPAGVDLLNQVAGKQSVFAWYDIGKLEFLYITRMPASQALQSQLLQARGTFQRRHAGNADFYIKTGSADYSTVAFAQVSDPSGNLLILATREDLIANALNLIAHQPTTGSVDPTGSLAQEPWFQDASAALPPETPGPALHMVLNLDRIARDPHFQSYWIQRNITWTRQFRASASDLYLERNRFREERALLPKSPTPPSPDAPNLASLADLAPPSTGVVRAVATDDQALATTAIQEKLLGTDTTAAPNSSRAPDPTLDAPQSGVSTDLEVRIDALPPVPASASFDALHQAFAAAHLDALMTLSSAEAPPQPGSLWVPIHSAVVLHAASSWNSQTFAAALQQALRGSLTTSTIGIDFHTQQLDGATVYSLDGPRPLFFSISSNTPRGNLVLVSDHLPLLQQLQQNLSSPVSPQKDPATLIAAFNHQSQRQPYSRLVTLLDGNQPPPPSADTAPPSSDTDSQASAADPQAATPAAPLFFSGTVRSLSNTFSSLQSERILQRNTGTAIHQTVVYAW
jgi:hypothetical protein